MVSIKMFKILVCIFCNVSRYIFYSATTCVYRTDTQNNLQTEYQLPWALALPSGSSQYLSGSPVFQWTQSASFRNSQYQKEWALILHGI